jgi:hypothetical protein
MGEAADPVLSIGFSNEPCWFEDNPFMEEGQDVETHYF